jgi:hypothetical protein
MWEMWRMFPQGLEIQFSVNIEKTEFSYEIVLDENSNEIFHRPFRICVYLENGYT